ncbi:hypothetical protein ABIA33_002981 [Streptacidiphilus sp. MAP12-16]|uniref:hypothetical protein n=1 Tax=Streptacidiphilus sp. MAP12-16 TaxID=3156300 RepID=UPI003515044A
MSRLRHFHLDHAGHSITVDVRRGHGREVELLIDGKEVGYRRERASDMVTMGGELPEDPPQRFAVRVDHLRHRTHAPACTLLLDGREIPMPEREVSARWPGVRP